MNDQHDADRDPPVFRVDGVRSNGTTYYVCTCGNDALAERVALGRCEMTGRPGNITPIQASNAVGSIYHYRNHLPPEVLAFLKEQEAGRNMSPAQLPLTPDGMFEFTEERFAL